jgi:predicted naringenin-chalcone synthase
MKPGYWFGGYKIYAAGNFASWFETINRCVASRYWRARPWFRTEIIPILRRGLEAIPASNLAITQSSPFCRQTRMDKKRLMTVAHINRIGTALPSHDVHASFVAYMHKMLNTGKSEKVFDRMVQRSGIAHRYSVLPVDDLATERSEEKSFYRLGAYPSTAQRMRAYEKHAPGLVRDAVDALDLRGQEAGITHLVVASCTGFVAPGLDQILAKSLGLRPDLQRTFVGFMGCSAAVPALRVAQQAVLADPSARVLVVNVELCTLHLQETTDLETALSFLLFGDGCSAALVTRDETGIALHDFRAALIPESEDLITWHIGDQGFDMYLSGKVPGRIVQALREDLLREDAGGLLRGEGTQAVDLWAVHAGGRTILDAVETGFALDNNALRESRAVLAEHGNMSSATVMFVLKRMLANSRKGKRGMAMAFGPGVVAETFRFSFSD